MNKQQYSGYMDFISAVERNARKQIDMYRVSFLETVKKSNDEMTKRVVNAFDLLDEGYWNNDVHKATMGISGLADVIGAKEELDQINMTFLEENWIGG